MALIAQVHAGLPRRASNLAGVKLLGRKKDNSRLGRRRPRRGPVQDAEAGQSTAGTTAPKGRPTPKRSEAARKRGPVAPAPMTAAEARRRRKELGGPKLTREERKADRVDPPCRDGRTPRTDDGRRRRLPAAARQGPGAPLRARRRGLAPQRARAVHARGARPDLRHARGAVAHSAAPALPGDAGPDGDHGDRRIHPRPQGEPAWSTRSSRTTPKVVGSSAFTPPAAPHSCAGCARRGRRSSAATVSPDGA